MPTINEIKQEIAQKIAGQGSQVDIGNGLPSVLNGVADLIQETQSLSANGYKFYGFYNVENDSGEEDAGYPTVPVDYQNQHYFILVYNAEDEYFGVFEPYNAEIWQMLENSGTGIITHVYNKIIRRNEETTNGYITPKCLVDYIKFFNIDSFDFEDSVAALTETQEEAALNAVGVIDGNKLLPSLDGLLQYQLDNAGSDTLWAFIKSYPDGFSITGVSRVWGRFQLEMTNGRIASIEGIALVYDETSDPFLMEFSYS